MCLDDRKEHFGAAWACLEFLSELLARQKFGLLAPFFADQEVLIKTLNTPRLARNAPFTHLGAPTGCQSVVLSVHMAAKTRHSRRVFGRKTARKWPKRGAEGKNSIDVI